MALMIPADMSEFKTEGERRFYRFLENVALPHNDYIVWYTPDINGREPDFILFSRNAGLIIFEVKDWLLEQIKEANSYNFILIVGMKEESRKSPLYQAKDYQGSLLDKIKHDGYLLSRDPEHLGKPKIPVRYGVVLANINKYEYSKRGFDRIIGYERIFFWDDLHPESDICSDPTGKAFSERLKTMFPPYFPFTITPNEYNHLRQLIFPSIRIELPERSPKGGYAEQLNRLLFLDHHQESFARKYDGGHRILLGPSGSGKTLVLIHKAAFLKQYNPAVKNILFICYNITLVNFIKRLLSDKGIHIGEGIEVMHFYQLCSKILGYEVHYEKEDEDYYKLVVEEVLSKLSEAALTYDAILVDEGQDFSDDMYRIVTKLLNPKTDNLTIALDENQNIYQARQSWKEVGIKAQGRVHRMMNIYRNTFEIKDFAMRFSDNLPELSGRKMLNQPALFKDIFEYHGPKPDIRQFRDFDAIIEYIISGINVLTEKEGYPLSEIAILYPVKHQKDNHSFSIPEALRAVLESRGIFNFWVSEDYRSKRSYDITTNSVTISTIHSVKGLDYAVVFLVGLDMVEPGKPWTEEQLRNLIYVGITRARYKLFVPYTIKNWAISKLLESNHG